MTEKMQNVRKSDLLVKQAFDMLPVDVHSRGKSFKGRMINSKEIDVRLKQSEKYVYG